MDYLEPLYAEVDEPEYEYACACLPDNPEQELNFED